MVGLVKNLFDKLNKIVRNKRINVKCMKLNMWVPIDADDSSPILTNQSYKMSDLKNTGINSSQDYKENSPGMLPLKKKITDNKHKGSVLQRKISSGFEVSRKVSYENPRKMTFENSNSTKTGETRISELNKNFSNKNSSQNYVEIIIEKPKDLTELINVITRFLKENQKTIDQKIYEQFFLAKKTEFLEKYDVTSVLEVYLQTYIECYYDSA